MIDYSFDIDQGTPEWHQMRCGVVTASTINTLLTAKTLKIAANETVRLHALEMAAQRETGVVEDQHQTFQMQRGHMEEVLARDVYSEAFEQVTECGFIRNDSLGPFTIGYSPDGLVSETGLIEIKSRIQKHQVKTIINDVVPAEYMLQMQTGLMVTGREWCDFISYSNGMPLFVKRVTPNEEIQQKILDAVTLFEQSVSENQKRYRANSEALVKCERVDLSLDDEIEESK